MSTTESKALERSIRTTVNSEMRRRKWTRYRMWQETRVYIPDVSSATVYKFFTGERECTIQLASAMLSAVGKRLIVSAE